MKLVHCADLKLISQSLREQCEQQVVMIKAGPLVLATKIAGEKGVFVRLVPFGTKISNSVTPKTTNWVWFIAVLCLVAALYLSKPTISCPIFQCESTICPIIACPACPPTVFCPKLTANCPVSPTDQVFILWNKTNLASPTGVYTGQINSNRERHGFGLLIYSNGDKYEGEWKSGLKSGFGLLTTVIGEAKNGYWKEDELVYGEMKLRDGRIDRGEWKRGKMEGIGYRKTSKSVYFGEFQEGKEFDQGCEIRDGENMYFGQWSYGEKTGKGLSYSGDFLYYGDFLHSLRDGNGFAAWRQGLLYDGAFILGEKQGAGLETHTEEFWQSQGKKDWSFPHHPGGPRPHHHGHH